MSDTESPHEGFVTDDPDQSGERLDGDKFPIELPDRPVAAFEHGTTEAEQAAGEGLDRKLAREEPEDDGGTRSDASAAPPVQGDLGIDGVDDEKDLVGDAGFDDGVDDDSGQPDPMRGAEEEAMHVYTDVPGGVDRDPDAEDDEG